MVQTYIREPFLKEFFWKAVPSTKSIWFNIYKLVIILLGSWSRKLTITDFLLSCTVVPPRRTFNCFWPLPHLPVRIHGHLAMFRTQGSIERLRLIQRAEEEPRWTLETQIRIRVSVEVELSVTFARPWSLRTDKALRSSGREVLLGSVGAWLERERGGTQEAGGLVILRARLRWTTGGLGREICHKCNVM